MKNLREKLQKLDREIGPLLERIKFNERMGAVWESMAMQKKLKARFEMLDERRKAVRLERKKHGNQRQNQTN
jgi:hypothetical protein